MAFSFDFDKIMDKAEDLVQAGAHQTKKLAAVAKIKADNLAQKDILNKAYAALGQQYYALHGKDPEADMAQQCARIAKAMAAIGENNAKLAEMKSEDGVVEVTVETEPDPAEETPAEEAPAKDEPQE